MSRVIALVLAMFVALGCQPREQTEAIKKAKDAARRSNEVTQQLQKQANELMEQAQSDAAEQMDSGEK